MPNIADPASFPKSIPVFPLPGALLLPRGQMPLNIFEPRYLAMVDDALRDGHRLIGMIQPDVSHSQDEARPALFRVGCVGRITQLAEIRRRPLHPRTAPALSRFKVVEEIDGADRLPAMQGGFLSFADDFTARKGEARRSRGAARRC